MCTPIWIGVAGFFGSIAAAPVTNTTRLVMAGRLVRDPLIGGAELPSRALQEAR
jgi:hypothetical protein